VIRFPDPRRTDENGIVYVGGELTVENILQAYSLGIFPWPHANLPLLWFSPPARGVMSFKKYKIPRSVKKDLRKKNYRISFDSAFSQVIAGCASQMRDGQEGTWINASIIKVYEELFSLGHAHSVECWLVDEHGNEQLVGGLYGVYIKNVFSGESMFFRDSGASKACLIALAERLEKMGHSWFDIQMVTPILDLFGGQYVPREAFLKQLAVSQAIPRPWPKS
jgi:leucyl/phenylalanyl-tRNA---protein transferase